MFRKILIANRGEIAVRLVRACRDLGAASVAVYSDADRAALHVLLADEACRLGPAPAVESYLDGERVLDAARRTGCDALHPGYGFLAENAAFAAACARAGVVFIGPEPESMALLGEKTSARRLAQRCGVPILGGTVEPLSGLQEALTVAARVGYPVMLKAAAGGGGKGMRRAASAAELENAFPLAAAEALAAFGDGALFLERALEAPRHLEVQILGDGFGHRLALGERECSVQRRHQKLLEEAPAPRLRRATRAALTEAALALAAAGRYRSAGTVEFLLDADENFFFLEVNTRLQVEHPVTESVTGVDLAALQIRLAAGERLTLRPRDVAPRGHAIECRICAEDPEQDFFPSPGVIRRLVSPQGPGVREDSGVYAGWTVPLDYDPLLAKLVVWGADRAQAIARLRRALGEYRIVGVRHNLPFFLRLLDDPGFLGGRTDTGTVARLLVRAAPAADSAWEDAAAIAAAWAAQTAGAAPPAPAEPAPSPSSWSQAARRAALR